MARLEFPSLAPEYRALWDSMKFTRSTEINKWAAKIVAQKQTYRAIEAKSGVPWFVIGCLHMRESSLNFKRHLHNGDPLSRRTYHVPAGRPKAGRPPFTFVESAIDALTMPPHSLHDVRNWSVERCLYEMERYNGWGYRKYHSGTKSPYLWAGANHYTRGKYVADGKWSSTAKDQQLGCAPVLLRLAHIDRDCAERLGMVQGTKDTTREEEVPPVDEKTVEKPAVKSKTIWAALASVLSSLAGFASDWKILAIVVVGLLAAFIIYERTKKDDIEKGSLLGKLFG